MSAYSNNFNVKDVISLYLSELSQILSREEMLGILLDTSRIKRNTFIVLNKDENVIQGAVTFSRYKLDTSIDYLAVRSSCQGQRIGSSLLDHVLTHGFGERVFLRAKNMLNGSQNPYLWYISKGFSIEQSSKDLSSSLLSRLRF